MNEAVKLNRINALCDYAESIKHKRFKILTATLEEYNELIEMADRSRYKEVEHSRSGFKKHHNFGILFFELGTWMDGLAYPYDVSMVITMDNLKCFHTKLEAKIEP